MPDVNVASAGWRRKLYRDYSCSSEVGIGRARGQRAGQNHGISLLIPSEAEGFQN